MALEKVIDAVGDSILGASVQTRPEEGVKGSTVESH